jgi:hypothetical protein
VLKNSEYSPKTGAPEVRPALRSPLRHRPEWIRGSPSENSNSFESKTASNCGFTLKTAEVGLKTVGVGFRTAEFMLKMAAKGNYNPLVTQSVTSGSSSVPPPPRICRLGAGLLKRRAQVLAKFRNFGAKLKLASLESNSRFRASS